MRRPLWPLAALALIALIGAGCGSNASSDSSTAGGTDKKASKAVKYAECMRDNGVTKFPDPDASGELTIDAVANEASVDTDTAAFEEARDACKDLEPSGFTGHKRDDKQQDAALMFAQCIREHGVKDFPDPAKGDPLVDTRKIPSTDQPGGMDILNAAMQTCRDQASKAMEDQ
jgi:hypothetical protein